jgi:hypothetical protein
MISPQTVNDLKDWGQLLGYFVAVPVALLGIGKAIYEIQQGRKQRADELRWKRANVAKELLDDMHNDRLTKSAIHMLDWCDGQDDYEIQGEKPPITISYSDVLAALTDNPPKQPIFWVVYIRDCFDWFFYRVGRLEHYIRRGLIDFDDVRDVFKVYACEITKNSQIYDSFLAFHQYDLAREFFLRFKQS